MSKEGGLPQVNESQRIGLLAQKCFSANCPNDWAISDLSGTDDFGMDYQVQTLPSQRATDIFRVQLKGTLSPEINATGEYFSIQIKASTVRYYVQEPIVAHDALPAALPIHEMSLT